MSSASQFNTDWMVGAADVPGGVRGQNVRGPRESKRQGSKMTVSIIETSKGKGLEGLRGGGLAKGTRDTSAN